MVKTNGRNRMLTASEVAHLLNIHINTVRRWSDRGVLRAYRIGTRGDRRFDPNDIAQFLNNNGTIVENQNTTQSMTRPVPLAQFPFAAPCPGLKMRLIWSFIYKLYHVMVSMSIFRLILLKYPTVNRIFIILTKVRFKATEDVADLRRIIVPPFRLELS